MILEVGKCQVISTIWKEGTLSSNPCLVTMDTCPEAATAPCLSGGNNPGCATAPEDSGRAKAVYLVGLHFVPGRVGGDVSGGVCVGGLGVLDAHGTHTTGANGRQCWYTHAFGLLAAPGNCGQSRPDHNSLMFPDSFVSCPPSSCYLALFPNSLLPSLPGPVGWLPKLNLPK